tara:strand:- start:7225 stop:7962 length:738 start_codon:yes stop_codon:yes gene_type:complete
MSTHTFADVDAEQNKEEGKKKELTKEVGSSELSAYSSGAEGPSPEDYNIEHIQILGRSSQFDPEGGEIGDICVNKETPLVHVSEPVRCVLVHTRKYWKENVPYDDETTPRFANTLEEKVHIEKTTEFAGTVPVCDVTVLLERPESFENDEAAAGVFIYEFGGKEYALVKYTVQKSQAVRENYGTINVVTRARATKGDDAGKYYFELRSKEKGAGTKYKWHQFVLSGTAQEAPQEAADFARSLRGE